MTFKWKIFYDDGSTFANADGAPETAPKRGVQIVVQADKEHGCRTERENDYYVWWKDEWRGMDIFGLWDYLTQPGYSLVLFGRLIPYPEYRDCLQRAINDPDIPVKTGRRPGERS